jgi:hypothetical protein
VGGSCSWTVVLCATAPFQRRPAHARLFSLRASLAARSSARIPPVTHKRERCPRLRALGLPPQCGTDSDRGAHECRPR